MSLEGKAAACVEAWRKDFPRYARQALRIQTKEDAVRPLVLNPMQEALHTRLEAQKASTGKVRAIILKSRQMGCSTYVAARFFHQVHLSSQGRRAYLLAHEDDACKKLVRMYRLFWDQHEPDFMRCARHKSNDHGFELANGGGLESDTASTPQGGRGGTKTLMHWSEVAFSRHYAAHNMGSMQQIAEGPGTEIILESTPNGPVGGFYERYRTAEAGRGDYEAHFYPWTIDPTYVARVPHGFTLSREPPNEVVASEHEYAERYGCTLAQMAWRRAKIEEMSADGTDGALKFTQEFSADSTEAFLSASGQSLLSPAQVEAARKRPTFIGSLERLSPLVLGLDPAPGHAASASALAWRRGPICFRMDRLHGLDATQLIERVYREMADSGAERLCIDCSEGTGEAVYRELMRRPLTAGKCVRVVFGAHASDRSRWYNLRAEIWSKMASWIADGAAILDEAGESGQTLASELLSVHTKPGSERVIQLEAKADVVKRLGRSPDGADALACTFAVPDPTPHSGSFTSDERGVHVHRHSPPRHRRTGSALPASFVAG